MSPFWLVLKGEKGLPVGAFLISQIEICMPMW